MSKAKTTISNTAQVALRKKKRAYDYSLYLDIVKNNERKREFLNLYITEKREDAEKDRETLAMAESIRSLRVNQMRNEEHGEIDKTKRDIDFVKFFEEIGKEKKISTWTSASFHLKNFLDGKKLRMRDITPKWLDSFKKYLIEHTGSQNSAATYYERIKTAMRIAVRDGIVTQNPCEKVASIGRVKVIRGHHTLEELTILNKTPFPTEYDSCKAYLFSCSCGLRYSDIEDLRKRHFHGDEVQKYQIKTGEPVYVPLSVQAKKYLPDLTLLKDDDKIFNLPKALHSVNEHLEKWSKLAALTKHIHFHMGRHTFAVNFLLAGNDIYTLKEFLGHTDLRSTQQYAKIVNAVKKKAVANLPEF